MALDLIPSLVIASVVLVGTGMILCVCCYGRRPGKKREVESGDDPENALSEGQTEPVMLLDGRLNMARGMSSLQPQRRIEMVIQEGSEPVGTLIRRPTPMLTNPEASHTAEEYVEELVGQTAPVSADSGIGVREPGATTRSPPPALSIVIPNLDQRIQVAPGPASAPPTSHQFVPSATIRASRPSTMYVDSIYPDSTLPSYPGTARSASPPPYSALSRTRSRRTARAISRGASNYTDGAAEPMPDLARLGELRTLV
ncbi:hypothetical protein BDZ94DRAFT_1258933 [Collybia nuda]|uniref:Uncharacterized protein n=1 Tax=Collybia nuda TaxID=64659 RepID=A0A9P6CIN2_9AGAR|nr:hypothetical protein BDZ94DRAFT_1258933 [Collybia nuda]